MNKTIFKNNDEKQVEKYVGIECYLTTEFQGIGGEYKNNYKDFIVKEITLDGHILEIREDSESLPFLNDSKDKFTLFNLVKVNQDAFQAFKEVSKALKIPLDIIGYAGIKDKCAITVQQASIPGNHIESLKKVKLRDMYVRNIQPSKKPIRIGDHQGNNFTIVLRNVKNIEGLEKNVKNIIKAIDENGFINYYGLQRFGTLRPNSHKIGQYILQEDYENAYKEFVTSIYSSESPMAQRAREFLQKTEDLTAAVSEFPKSLKYEIKMIEHLIKNPGDYEGALDTLPPGLKSLLISAFQSWCFNKMISLRSEEGIPLVEPINGDVIGILDEERGNITRVKYLYGGPYDKYLKKAMDLNRAVIVVPLIGYGTDLNDFPAMKNIMNKLIAQESIDLDVFNKKILEKYDFKGSFRAMIVKPMGLKLFKIAEDENNPGKKKIKMEFSLSRGSYATILLREFIK